MAFTPNYISQQDPDWKNVKLGFGNVTIGTDGCAITALTILVNGFGHDETPKTVNKKLKDLGERVGFYGALVVWSALSRIFPKVKYQTMVHCRDRNEEPPMAAINAALSNGQPVIVETDRLLASGLQPHWVVLYEKRGDDYLMLDPWPYPPDNKETLLTVRYGFGRSAREIITAVIWYEGQSAVPSTPVSPPPPLVETDLFVSVLGYLTGGLRLRSEATTMSDTLAVEPAGTQLRVIEPESEAQSKIGVEGQWLRVRDTQGLEGYVAAWYVEAAQPPRPEPEEPETIEPVEPSEPTPSPVTTPDSRALIDAVNTLRVANGRSPYIVNDKLNGIAQQHATYMASSRQVTHLSADGKRPFQRAIDAGYNLSGDLSQGGFMSENILAGLGIGPDAAIAQWQVDASHTNTLLSENYTEVGAGVAKAENLTYLCLDAAMPTTSPVTPPPVTEPEEPEPEQPSSGRIKIYVSPSVGERGLVMYKAVNGPVLTTLRARSELTCLEGEDTANKKIGVFGKWLFVRDKQANSGYVDATMVVLNLDAEPEPTEPEIPPQPDSSIPVLLEVAVSQTVGTSGLRLRAQPSFGGSLITVLKAGTVLTVQENAEAARSKIGVNNLWLNVTDPTGRVGYVAAWYVEEVSAPTPSSEETTPVTPTQPIPSTLIVFVSSLAAAGLRMRSGPSINTDVVKVLPANSRLTVLETYASAELKVGKYNQWLQVKDSAGEEGYVAAWYVVK